MNNSPVFVSVPCDMFLFFFFCWVTLNVLKISRNLLDAGFYFIYFFQNILLPKALPQGPIPYPVTYPFWQITVGPLLWDTSIQVTPPFEGHKTWSRKNVHIISVFVTSIKGKLLFRRKGHFFWVQTLVSPLFRGHLSNQKVTDDKNRCLFTSHNGDSLQNMN